MKLLRCSALALALAAPACGDTHPHDTRDDHGGEHGALQLDWDQVALGCTVMGEGDAAHVMCNHGHSFNYRSDNLYARWLYLRDLGYDAPSDADLMMGPADAHETGATLPPPLTPTLRAHVGERTRVRVMSYGPEFHTFHIHGHLWLDGDTLIDNRTLGPAEVHQADFFAGAGHATPEERVGAGDWMYHCHVETHAASGMWGVFRVLEPGDDDQALGDDGRFPNEVPPPRGGPGETVDVWVVAAEVPVTVTREYFPALTQLVEVDRMVRAYVPMPDAEAFEAATASSVQATVRPHKATWQPWILSLREGTTVRVHLKNLMPEHPASLHPHAVITSPADDGTMPGSVAWPGGEPVTYTWTADTPGTWPLHDHARTIENVGRGLFGALVVKSADEEAELDRDYLVILHDYDMDWFMGSAQPSGGGH